MQTLPRGFSHYQRRWLSVLGCAFALAACKAEAPPAAPAPLAVTVVAAEARSVPLTREWVGRVEAFRQVEVRPQIEGACVIGWSRSGTSSATRIFCRYWTRIFLYPRFASGEINALLFQVTLVVMGVATFSFVFASFYYYGSSLGSSIDDAERAQYSRRGDRFWLLGYTLLFLDPSLILFSVGLLAVGSVWFALWLVYFLFVIRHFPRVQTARKSS